MKPKKWNLGHRNRVSFVHMYIYTPRLSASVDTRRPCEARVGEWSRRGEPGWRGYQWEEQGMDLGRIWRESQTEMNKMWWLWIGRKHL